MTGGALDGRSDQIDGRSPSDFYYSGDQPIRLERSSCELVIRFRAEADEEKHAIVAAASPGARLGSAIRSEGRTVHVVTIPPQGSRGSRAEAVLERLRTNAAVEFAAAVFYEPRSGTRMLPTDEIIAKPKSGVTRGDLLVMLRGRFTIVRTMVGAEDEYVLRLNDPHSDPLAMSRALYESGRFEWVEPNFIRELRSPAPQ